MNTLVGESRAKSNKRCSKYAYLVDQQLLETSGIIVAPTRCYVHDRFTSRRA